jgi:hypothetical protein
MVKAETGNPSDPADVLSIVFSIKPPSFAVRFTTPLEYGSM